MSSSLWSGISGLNASGKQMDVIGNNIANVNTVGFKAGGTVFGDILSQSISGSSMQVGRGVGVTAVPTLFGQGSFASTQSATDLAIDGEGFFMVNNSDGSTYYTRAGMFNMGEGGYLRDVNGYKVQGYLYSNGVNTNAIGDISLSGLQSDPSASTEFSIGVNLDSEAATGEVFISAQTVYDSLGGAHTLKMEFTKLDPAIDPPGARSWAYHAYLEHDGVYTESNTTTAAAGTITFDANGNLTDPAADVPLEFSTFQIDPDLNPSGATFGDGGSGPGTNNITWIVAGSPTTSLTPEVMTGYASPSVNRSLVSDGWASGELQNLSIGDDGVIDGFFTNGQSAGIGQVALAKFTNTLGLKKMGSSLFAATVSSGDALINKPGTGGLGGISPNSLEMSNADIATEFINMITAQKAYQASAKVVSTTDSMMSELMNIKR
ncbi:MAG: flagellar hook protein FlgE [Deltaproteobacteria bacterium]|nr:flagellar hook protein FlgE [Deltaproteobacteria bacterium]MBW2081218.1 flagellar hook protein FlgE [Deltaproteobacteria bacterium]